MTVPKLKADVELQKFFGTQIKRKIPPVNQWGSIIIKVSCKDLTDGKHIKGLSKKIQSITVYEEVTAMIWHYAERPVFSKRVMPTDWHIKSAKLNRTWIGNHLEADIRILMRTKRKGEDRFINKQIDIAIRQH